MKTMVTKWGNSQGIRIPKEIMDKMDIRINSVVTVDCLDSNCITIKKEEPSTLEELYSNFCGKPFNQLTRNELQCDTGEWDTGKPAGKEIW